MSAVVFCGPTLAAARVRGLLAAEVRPPARQGDIYRAASAGPAAIGLIDGYFDGVPSVWHKEILWALEQGIAVFGSASMGALRAAELDRFGMIGVGTIYEAYASGSLCDDDEVALQHGPEALGFPPLSEPMVSVRATLDAACGAGVLARGTAEALRSAAKALFYKHRSWDRILAEAGVGAETRQFSDWLPGGRVDAKARDACEMLRRMAAHLEQHPAPAPPRPQRMERTLAWQGLTRRMAAQEPEAAERAVLDELRLDPPRYAALHPRACLRLFMRTGRVPRGTAPGRAALLEEMARHRSSAGLPRRRDLQRWLAENGLDTAGYEDLLRGSVQAGQAGALAGADLGPHLLAELRLSGGYAALAARAEAKRRAAQATGADPPLDPAGQQALLIWFFEELWDLDLPPDLEAYAAGLGLADRPALCRLIAEEYRFRHAEGGAVARGSG
ncbi:TfuA-like protein [Cribrihabitans pelagius]|uniref:TfuA-like protein n=1 Tax=Cribrihabitans pelagius TaxID=1765746 RepID=UPI003B593166